MRTTRGAVVAAGVALSGSLVAPGYAPSAVQPKTLIRANLTAGQVVPTPSHVNGDAGGAFSATVAGRRITWRMTFRGLTGRATRAEIHYGRRGRSGGLAVPLCSRCTSGITGSVLNASQTLRTALLNGRAYVIVLTKRNPQGEIRGQISKS